MVSAQGPYILTNRVSSAAIHISRHDPQPHHHQQSATPSEQTGETSGRFTGNDGIDGNHSNRFCSRGGDFLSRRVLALNQESEYTYATPSGAVVDMLC